MNNHMEDAMIYMLHNIHAPDLYHPPLNSLNVTIPALYKLNQSNGDICGDEMTVELRVIRGGHTYIGASKFSGKATQPYTRAIALHEIDEVCL